MIIKAERFVHACCDKHRRSLGDCQDDDRADVVYVQTCPACIEEAREAGREEGGDSEKVGELQRRIQDLIRHNENLSYELYKAGCKGRQFNVDGLRAQLDAANKRIAELEKCPPRFIDHRTATMIEEQKAEIERLKGEVKDADKFSDLWREATFILALRLEKDDPSPESGGQEEAHLVRGVPQEPSTAGEWASWALKQANEARP